MHPLVIAAIVAGVILFVVIMACMRAAARADEDMGIAFDRDLPPEPLRLRDREHSADLD